MASWHDKLRLCLCFFFACVSLFSAELVLIAEPQPTAVVLGGHLLLDCLGEDDGGDWDVSYLWQFGGVPVSQALPQAAFFPNHSLFISDVNSEALGTYHCTIWLTDRPQHTLTSDVVIVVESYLSNFTLHPKQQVVQPDDLVTLTCVTGKGAPPPILSWEKDGLEFMNGAQEFGIFGSAGPGSAIQKSGRLEFVAEDSLEGSYRCVSRNPLTNEAVESQAATVNIEAAESAPSLHSAVPAALILTAGAPHTIACPITGVPTPNITWVKVGDSIDSNTNTTPDGHLVFHSVHKSNRGRYYCRGINDLGSTQSSKIEVTVAYLDVFFHGQPQSSTVIAGQELTLTCDPPDSHPPAEVLWYKDGAQFVGRTGEMAVSVWNNGNLFFRNVQLADQGQYFCVALNQLAGPKSVRSETATLTVYGSPVLVEPPVPTQVIKGHTLHLTCRVQANPVAVTRWQRNEDELQSTSRVHFWKGREDLTISDVIKSDEGLYSCTASNDYGTAHSAQVLVTVIVPPEIRKDMESQTVRQGSDVFLPCQVYADPPPIISWFFEEDKVRPSDRIDIQPDGLLIHSILKSDEGQYSCQGDNEAGRKVISAMVHVQVAPHLVSFPADQVVTQLQAVVLHCEASADPPATITWLFNGSSTLPHNAKLTPDTTTVIIASADSSHSGSYTCVASNDAGNHSKTASLLVQEPPVIEGIEGNIIINRGDDLDLTCLVRGTPHPAISWQFTGQIIEPSSNVRVSFPTESSMRVKFLTGSDSGSYACVARNAAGVDSMGIRVQVRETPLPPVLKATFPVSMTSVNLSWTPAVQEPHTEVDAFVIQFKENHQAQFRLYKDDVSPVMTWYEVGDLKPATQYLFQMAALNDIGTGKFGPPLGVATLETAPSEVRSLQLLSSSPTSLQLQWQMPAVPNGDIRLYQLAYKPRFQQTEFTLLEIHSPALPLQHYTLQGLTPYTTFTLKVRAATIEAGTVLWGGFSSPLDVTTSASEPSASPSDVHLSVLSSSVVQVQWKKIADSAVNGELQGYHILYRQSVATVAPLLKTADSVSTTAEITGLLPWRYYDVQVAVCSDVGRGPLSSVQSVRTMAEVPTGSPTGVQVQATSATSVLVTWQPVPESERNSEISGYIVRYTATETDHTVYSQYIGNPNTLSVDLSGLIPWTGYSVQVQAFTTQVREGFGPLSPVYTVRTSQSTPGSIQNLMLVATSPQSVTLTWDEPAHSNGIIQSYHILYQLLGVADLETTTAANGNQENLDARQQGAGHSTTAIVSPEVSNYTLQGLQSRCLYYVGVTARTAAGPGPLVNTTVITDTTTSVKTTGAASTAPATTSQVWTTSTETTEQTNTSPVSEGDTSRRLSSQALVGVVVGATLVGLLLLLTLTLLIILCCRKRRKRTASNSFHSSTYSVGSSASNHPAAARTQSSTKPLPQDAHRTIPSSSSHLHQATDQATAGHGRESVTVGAHGSQRVEGRVASSTNATCNTTDTEREFEKLGQVRSQRTERSQGVHNSHHIQPHSARVPPSLQSLFVPHNNHGVDNPAFEGDGAVTLSRLHTARQSAHSLPAVYTSSTDLWSQVPVTKRRQNRMHSSSAAAIAAQRNVSSSIFDDTESLIHNDSVVVYDERTVL